MKKSTVGPLFPACPSTHNVLDRLTVIVGHIASDPVRLLPTLKRNFILDGSLDVGGQQVVANDASTA